MVTNLSARSTPQPSKHPGGSGGCSLGHVSHGQNVRFFGENCEFAVQPPPSPI